MINLTVLEELASRLLKDNKKDLDTVLYLLVQMSLSGEELVSFTINTKSYNLSVRETNTSFSRFNIHTDGDTSDGLTSGCD